MIGETIRAELLGTPTLEHDDRHGVVARCSLIVDDHDSLPELMQVLLVNRAEGTAAMLADHRHGRMVCVTVRISDRHNIGDPYIATDLWPASEPAPDPPVSAPKPVTPDQVHDNIVQVYVKPVAEVLAGLRPPAGCTDLIDPTIRSKFVRFAKPLGAGHVNIDRTYVQVGYPRIDVSAAIRIGTGDDARTHPVALGINMSTGTPEIDAIYTPRLRIKGDKRASMRQRDAVTSTRGHHPIPGQAAQR